MRKGILSLLALSLLTSCMGGGEPTHDNTQPQVINPQDIKATVESLDEFSLKTMMEQLTGVQPVNLSVGNFKIAERGSASGRGLTQQYLMSSFTAMGLETSYHDFTSSAGKAGRNVEAILRGVPGGRHLYVSAHMDSVSNAGANDDASGISAILMMARALRQSKPRDTIHFVAFDLEEDGLIGSYYYVRDRVLPQEAAQPGSVMGVIQSDMIGHASSARRIVWTDCDDAPELKNALFDAVEELDLNLASEEGCAGRSDHERFTDQGFQAVFAIDDTYYGLYPWYHEPTDTLDKVNLNFLLEVTRALTGAVMRLTFPAAESPA